MMNFSHPNVLGIVGVVFNTPNGIPHLVLPFMENGTLKSFLKSQRENASTVHTTPQVDFYMLVTEMFCHVSSDCCFYIIHINVIGLEGLRYHENVY